MYCARTSTDPQPGLCTAPTAPGATQKSLTPLNTKALSTSIGRRRLDASCVLFTVVPEFQRYVPPSSRPYLVVYEPADLKMWLIVPGTTPFMLGARGSSHSTSPAKSALPSDTVLPCAFR